MESRATRRKPAPAALVVAALLAGLYCAAAPARMILEVVQLQHRLVRDMIPALQPLLAEGGTLTGTSDRLIVRTTPENLLQLREAIAALDTRQRQLRITVTQDRDLVAQQAQDTVAVGVAAGSFGARVPGAGSPVDAGRSTAPDTTVEYQTVRTQSAAAGSQSHFVVGLEGEPAFIETGQDVPYGDAAAAVTPYGASVSTATTFRNVSSGFYVTPHLQGPQVVLDVAPRSEVLQPYGDGYIEHRGAGTTVSGRLGEWIAIAGARETAGGQDAELLARTRRAGDNTYTVWVKVEEQR